MADYLQAAKELCRLFGLLDSAYNVRWGWFGNLETQPLQSLVEETRTKGENTDETAFSRLLACLGVTEAEDAEIRRSTLFTSDLAKTKNRTPADLVVLPGTADSGVGVGLAWASDGMALRFGVGGSYSENDAEASTTLSSLEILASFVRFDRESNPGSAEAKPSATLEFQVCVVVDARISGTPTNLNWCYGADPPEDPAQQLAPGLKNLLNDKVHGLGDALEKLLSTPKSLLPKSLTESPAHLPPSAWAVIHALAGDPCVLTVPVGSSAMLKLELSPGASADGVALGFEVKPPVDEAESAIISSFGAVFALQPAKWSLGLELKGLQIPQPENTNGILIAPPDKDEVPGLDISIKVPNTGAVELTARALIPIQRRIVPLYVESLLVDLTEKRLVCDVECEFDFVAVQIRPVGLGVEVDFTTAACTPHLRGLGISLSTSMVQASGALGKVNDDYIGQALLKVVRLFELAAIGGYSRIDNTHSLFVFAALNAPLGGPPWCFVTGIAGGLGINRQLPPVTSVLESPFMRVINGEISLETEGGINERLSQLSKQFDRAPGSFWLAGGLTFTSFGFIQGKLLGTFALNPFSLTLMGLAAFNVAEVAAFELEFLSIVDEEKLGLTASLTRNSYLFDPDIARLQGGFGLFVWHSGVSQGDFVLSVGGYHPDYKRPVHYPVLDRVGLSASLFGFVTLKAESYFACTSRELMMGGHLAVVADVVITTAGFDVWADVLIEWDPFYLRANLGICVWFYFFGRHEVGVELDIHTPPFGGTATVDLALISFDVDFGAEREEKPVYLPLGQFISNHLRLPIASGEGYQGSPLIIPTLANQGSELALFRIDVLSGRVGEPGAKEDGQKGLLPSAPILVNPEFSFAVRTRIPLLECETPVRQSTAIVTKGVLTLPLCGLARLPHELTVTLRALSHAKPTRRNDRFPASLFGETVGEIAPDADNIAGQIQAVCEAPATVSGVGELTFVADAERSPSVTPFLTSLEEERDALVFPLPLGPRGANASVPLHRPQKRRPKGASGVALTGIDVLTAWRSSRAEAQAAASPRSEASEASEAQALRRIEGEFAVARSRICRAVPRRAPKVSQITRDAKLVPVVPVPASPVRRRELRALSLAIQPPGVRLFSPSALRLPRMLPAVDADLRSLAVPLGRAVLLDRPERRAWPDQVSLNARASASQVRMVGLNAFGRPITHEANVRHAGFSVSPNVRRMVLLGEPPNTQESSVGIVDETLVLVLDRFTFSAPGCLMEALSGCDTNWEHLSQLEAREVFAESHHLLLHFPTLASRGCLVVLCEAGSRSPSLGCRVENAQGTNARSLSLGDGRHALILDVATSNGAWRADVQAPLDARLQGVVFVPAPSANVISLLQRAQGAGLLTIDWDHPTASVAL